MSNGYSIVPTGEIDFAEGAAQSTVVDLEEVDAVLHGCEATEKVLRVKLAQAVPRGMLIIISDSVKGTQAYIWPIGHPEAVRLLSCYGTEAIDSAFLGSDAKPVELDLQTVKRAKGPKLGGKAKAEAAQEAAAKQIFQKLFE